MRYLILALCLWCSTAFSAEMLVCAQDSPSDDGCKTGDILVVRPDGHGWGNEECPPRYIVVKVPEMTYEEAKDYEQPLMVDDGVDEQGNPKQKMLRLRKSYIPDEDVEEAKNNGGKITRTKAKKLQNIKIKTSKIDKKTGTMLVQDQSTAVMNVATDIE